MIDTNSILVWAKMGATIPSETSIRNANSLIAALISLGVLYTALPFPGGYGVEVWASRGKKESVARFHNDGTSYRTFWTETDQGDHNDSHRHFDPATESAAVASEIVSHLDAKAA